LIQINPETRYLTLLKEEPLLIQKIPQYMIATYLDIIFISLKGLFNFFSDNP